MLSLAATQMLSSKPSRTPLDVFNTFEYMVREGDISIDLAALEDFTQDYMNSKVCVTGPYEGTLKFDITYTEDGIKLINKLMGG